MHEIKKKYHEEEIKHENSYDHISNLNTGLTEEKKLEYQVIKL